MLKGCTHRVNGVLVKEKDYLFPEFYIFFINEPVFMRTRVLLSDSYVLRS